ncbi:hypothetical protein L1987_57661 [Smallanthus sonchifolius]|uniref:Uncharacterized protein n=1 Tax=Smallanthus sonchifolius TaxID=185202 RepID=A0ACB9DDB8_9ASTR|nr:hypothetical protein L1987_57661 [Smallanthus sonchifolius]
MAHMCLPHKALLGYHSIDEICSYWIALDKNPWRSDDFGPIIYPLCMPPLPLDNTRLSSKMTEYDGDDKDVVVDQQSTYQGTKPTYTTTEGQVLDDLDAEDNISDSVGVSSPIQKSDDEQTPPAKTSCTNDKTQ